MHTSGGHTGSGPASGGLFWIVIALACGWCVSAPAADAVAEGFRVESEVYANGAQEPVARTLTLFRGRIAWDFIETVPSAASDRPQAGAAVTQPAQAHAPSARLFVSAAGAPKVPPAKPAEQLTAYAVAPSEGAGGMTEELAKAASGGCASARTSAAASARL